MSNLPPLIEYHNREYPEYQFAVFISLLFLICVRYDEKMKKTVFSSLQPIPGRPAEKMLPKGTALVLEGGGLRGFYSAGVFEALMDAGVMFPYIIAVSAGAANVLSYVSGQSGRNRQVLEYCVQDKRYISKRNLIRNRSLFGMEFIFHEVPGKYVVFDWESFYRQNIRLLTGALDCRTGKTVWFEKKEIHPDLDPIIASCSIPILAPIRRFNGYELLDGGIADPIPIEQSIADGNDFHVIVLTRNAGYRKKPFKQRWLLSTCFRRYPNLVEAILTRHEKYNRQLELCEELERQGRAMIIRPLRPLQVSGNRADIPALLQLHDEGHQEAVDRLKQLRFS